MPRSLRFMNLRNVQCLNKEMFCQKKKKIIIIKKIIIYNKKTKKQKTQPNSDKNNNNKEKLSVIKSSLYPKATHEY